MSSKRSRANIGAGSDVESDEYQVGDAIFVMWEESGVRFPATIRAVNSYVVKDEAGNGSDNHNNQTFNVHDYIDQVIDCKQPNTKTFCNATLLQVVKDEENRDVSLLVKWVDAGTIESIPFDFQLVRVIGTKRSRAHGNKCGNASTAMTYDVLYDERVRGELCVEKNVPAYRLVSSRQLLVENIGFDESVVGSPKLQKEKRKGKGAITSVLKKSIDEIIEFLAECVNESFPTKQPTTTSATVSISSPSVAMHTPVQTPESANPNPTPVISDVEDIASSMELTPKQTLMIHHYLTASLISDMVDKTPRTLALLTSLLGKSVMIDDVNMNFDEVCNSSSDEGMDNVKAWLGDAGLARPHFDMCSATIAAGCALLRIMSFVAANNIGYSLHASANVALSDEVVERVLQLSNSFLQCNISAPGMGNSRNSSTINGKKRKLNVNDEKGEENDEDKDVDGDYDDENTNSKEKKKSVKKDGKDYSKSKDVNRKTLLSFTLPIFIPLIRTLLYSLESFLSLRRQNERLCVSAYELAINVLRTDVSSNARSGQAESSDASLLVSVQYAAVMLVRCIFRKYPYCRQSMLLEFLPLFTQIYSPKHFGKDFLLQSISGLSSMSTTVLSNAYSVSMSFAGLMISLQAAVTSAGGLAAANTTANSEAQSPVESAEVSKHALSDTYRMCASFLNELLKRCSHKDTSAEFRNVATQILNEVFVALPSPKLPIVGIFLDQFVKRINHELNTHASSKDVKADKEDGRKDTTYSTFLMDLISIAGKGYRTFALKSEIDHQNVTSKIKLSDESKQVIISKLSELRPFVVQSISKLADNTSLYSSPAKKISPKKDKNVSPNPKGNEEGTSSSLQPNGKMDVGLALSFTSQVKAIALNAMARNPEGGKFQMATCVAPSLTLIFRDCLLDDDPSTLALIGEVLVALPTLDAPDEHFFALLAYLETEESLPMSLLLCRTFDEELAADRNVSTQKSGHFSGIGTATKGNFIRDAYDLFLAQWHSLSTAGKRRDVARLSLNLLSNSAASASGYLYRSADGQLLTSQKCENSVLTGAFFSGAASLVGKSVCEKLSLASLEEGEKRGFLTYEMAQSSYLSLLAENTFKIQFDFLLNCLLLQFSDPSPNIRARVVKTLHAIVECDPEIIRRDAVKDAITERFNDVAVSVREEAVKLVGSFTLKGKDISKEYVDALLIRLKDRGVSVRKAVVNIIKDILISQPEHPRYSAMCLALMEKASQAKEEESIKDVIRQTFQQLWFLPQASKMTSNMADSNGKNYVVSPIKVEDNLSAVVIAPITIVGDSEDVFNMINGSTDVITEEEIISPASGSVAIISEASSTEKNLGDYNKTSLSAPSSVSKQASRTWRNQQSLSQASKISVSKQVKTALTASHIRAITLQLVDLMMHIDNHTWMVVLMREMLHGKSSGAEASAQVKARRAASFNQCESLVSHMMDLLIVSEEKLDKDRIIAVISTLAVFSSADPMLLVNHVWSLTSYLKADNGFSAADETAICVKVIDILAATVVVQDVAFHTNITDIANDLINISLKFGGRCLDSAIACLSLLCYHHFKDVALLLGLYNKCFGAIVSIARSLTGLPSVAQLSNQQSAQVQRCLLVIGKVCQHSRKCLNLIRSFYNSSPTVAKSGLDILTWETDVEFAKRDIRTFPTKLSSPCGMYGACFSAVAFSLALPNIQIQRYSTQCLCGVFIGCSCLILVAEDMGIMKKLLGSTTHEAVLEKFLQALKDMMLAEEARLENSQAILDLKEAGANVGSRVIGGNTTGDGDASAAGFALQQHLPELIAITSSHFAGVRFACLELLGVMLRQGMVCPLDIVPLLVALQGDPEAPIRMSALQLLLIEDEKHPTFLDNRIADGLELAYIHQLKTGSGVHPLEILSHVSSNAEDTTVNVDIDLTLESSSTVTSIFSQVYTLCIQPVRKRRSDFISSVLRKIHNSIDNIHLSASKFSTSIDNLSKSTTDKAGNKLAGKGGLTVNGCAHLLSIITFLVTTIAHLPFEFSEEPLQIVYWINRNIPLASSMLLAVMKKGLLAIGGVTGREEGKMQPPMFGSAPKKSKQSIVGANSEYITDTGLLFSESGFADSLTAADTEIKIQLKLELVLANAAEARALESLLRLKAYMKAMYLLSDEKCALYSPNDTIASSATSATEKVKLFEYLGVYTTLPLSLPTIYRDLFLANFDSAFSNDVAASINIVATAVSDYNRLASTLDSDPQDFTLSKKEIRKRKKIETINIVDSTDPKGSPLTVGKKTKTSKKSPIKKRKKLTLSKRERDSDGDDDFDDYADNDDDDYTG